MRRMREGGWSLLIWGLPLAALGFGVYKLHQKGTFSKHGISVTRSTSVTDEIADQEDHLPSATEAPRPDRKQALEHQEVSHEGEGELPVSAPNPRALAVPRLLTTGAACASVELPGRSPTRTTISGREWQDFMKLFHDAKDDLRAWLKRYRGSLAVAAYEEMDKRVREIRIQRPPSLEEPDVAWRGIGVYSRDRQGHPLIRVGFGVIDWAAKDATRVRFELARLIGQGLAPCELQQASIDRGAELWSPVIKCLGLDKDHKCGPGTFSEAGWGVATTVAAWASPASCVIPAFADAAVASCLDGASPFVPVERLPASKPQESPKESESKGEHS